MAPSHLRQARPPSAAFVRRRPPAPPPPAACPPGRASSLSAARPVHCRPYAGQVECQSRMPESNARVESGCTVSRYRPAFRFRSLAVLLRLLRLVAEEGLPEGRGDLLAHITELICRLVGVRASERKWERREEGGGPCRGTDRELTDSSVCDRSRVAHIPPCR